MRKYFVWCLCAALAMSASVLAATVDFAGYTNCPVLDNGTARVVLGPQLGGRVLSYALGDKEAIPLNPAQDGLTWKPGDKSFDPYGGRCDVGPEPIQKPRPDLWFGPWQAKFNGPCEVIMTSLVDRSLGLQLVRTFRLSPTGSHLRFTQRIINRSDHTQRVCHWSRTFGQGNGICLVPLNPNSRFPKGYLTYGPGAVMNYAPEPHEHVRVRDGFLEINGDPPFSKFMLDTEPGRLAYLMRNDLMFVKKWPVYADRVYGEISAGTLSLYYYPFIEDRQKPASERGLPIDFCELEPIGPLEILEPGQTASFTEDWWLLPYKFPAQGQDANIPEVSRLMENAGVGEESENVKVEGEEGKPIVKAKSGLQYVVLEEGKGDKPKRGDRIVAEYTLWLTDGTKVDSSKDHGGEFRFAVGVGQVIAGWDEALLDMRPGERRKLLVPPELGYGPQGTPGGPIPPNATLIFEVKLVRVER